LLLDIFLHQIYTPISDDILKKLQLMHHLVEDRYKKNEKIVRKKFIEISR